VWTSGRPGLPGFTVLRDSEEPQPGAHVFTIRFNSPSRGDEIDEDYQGDEPV
jgi:hypothetical protein